MSEYQPVPGAVLDNILQAPDDNQDRADTGPDDDTGAVTAA